MMIEEEKKPAVSVDEIGEAIKKVYQTPAIREYGSINDLVQSNGGVGNDGGGSDDTNGSI
ncbi:MAG: hypothetical protein ACXVJD_05415 [Mucilaginibacter sp.]